MSAMKLGCIGPLDSVTVVKEVVEIYYPQVELRTYVEERTPDAWKRIKQCLNENAGVIFTGIGVETSVKAVQEIPTPHEHIPRGSHSIIHALWQIKNSKEKIKSISIDVVEKELLDEVLREYDISYNHIYVMPFSIEHQEEDYTKHHLDLYQSGKVDAIISGYAAVYEAIKQQQVPVYRLYPSTFQVRNNIETLINKINKHNLQSAGIAVQIVTLKNTIQDSINQYDAQKLRGLFYIELLEFVSSVQGSVFQLGAEYIIFSTRGIVEQQIHKECFKNLILWADKKKTVVASGIGLGVTAFDAEKSARKALANALKLPRSSVYIVNDSYIQGPIGEDYELSYSVYVTEKKDLEISKKIGISATYIEKIKSLIQSTGKDIFDSNDLASCLNITERSARRILKKLLDNGYATMSGKEFSTHAGRPKNLMKINL